MRKVILYVNVTADGFLSGPQGELDWMLPDEEMNQRLSDELRGRVDTILLGRNVYQAFEQVFRAQAADAASPPGLVDFATWMIEKPKVVFSRSGVEVSDVSRVADGDLAEEVAKLRAEPGGDLVLFGGVETVQQFVRLGLVDEYWIKHYPVALGAGRPLFTERTDLTLTDAAPYPSGIVVLRYTP
ncbi:dihydrofolate reductase family protein [Actinomadura rupiterrae]|uniref:dihydrofolate reductase family protein n=1 Tax=Actinomadura rupiterrae TaxID=559627 RepID=UPI0020A33978|nr:dihydrofolate reductase family protein [Actinomadura rupiterrae]MCP2338024.1 dihydrofolate reductase [Actinomadura rupiterrae]